MNDRRSAHPPPRPRAGSAGGAESGRWEDLVRALDALPDGALVADAHGGIVHVNQVLATMSGYAPPELVGEPVELLVPEAARELHRRERERYLAHPRIRPMAAARDLELRRRDGTRVPVDISLAPVETREGLLVLAAIRDASDRRRALDELRLGARLLGAVVDASDRLLREERVEDALGDVLAVLGRAVGAGSVAVLRVEARGSDPGVRLLRVWRDRALEAEATARFRGGSLPEPAWWCRVREGEPVEVAASELGPEEREILAPAGAGGLLAAPVVTGSGCWGALVVADGPDEGSSREARARAVRAVAGAIGAALAREEVLRRLRDSEARYRSLVERMPAVTYLVAADEAGSVAYVSGRVADLLGYPPEQFEADPGFRARVVHPDDRERVGEAWRGALEAMAPFSAEYRCLTRDGRVAWVLDASVPVRLGGGIFWHGVLVDITERVRAEEELRLSYELLRRTDDERRRLAATLLRAGEAERLRMAADLHDGPVQRLSAIQLRMELVARSCGDPVVAARLAELIGETRGVIGSLRRMVYEAHPPTLDRHGLAAALGEYAREAAAAHRYEVELRVDLPTEPPPDVRRTCFRLVQEALTNVGKHAAARRVEVRIGPREGGVWGSVRDDGVGFVPGDAPASGSSAAGVGCGAGIGLMRQRAELSGGWLRLRSAPGSGTTVEWWLPWNAEGPGQGPPPRPAV